MRYGVTINDFFIRRKEYEMKAVPGHGEGVNRQVDGRGKSEQTRKELLPVYAGLPLSPRSARHFPPRSGEADTKEKSNQVL